MVKSLLAVCPQSKITLYCTDDRSMEVFSSADLPIRLIRHEPSNHSTEEYVDYHTKNWNAVTEQKYRILLDFMKNSGETVFFYADCDLYFLKSPVKDFITLMRDENVHLIMQTDKPLGHKYCTGAMLIRNSTQSRHIFHTCLSNMSGDDQDTMNTLFGSDSTDPNGVFTFSDEFCPNGYLFFKSKQIKDPTIVHANFFLGMDQKISALTERGLWLV
jgi:hypothetical protein